MVRMVTQCLETSNHLISIQKIYAVLNYTYDARLIFS